MFGWMFVNVHLQMMTNTFFDCTQGTEKFTSTPNLFGENGKSNKISELISADQKVNQRKSWIEK